jgi:hypothetical protein
VLAQSAGSIAIGQFRPDAKSFGAFFDFSQKTPVSADHQAIMAEIFEFFDYFQPSIAKVPAATPSIALLLAPHNRKHWSKIGQKSRFLQRIGGYKSLSDTH